MADGVQAEKLALCNVLSASHLLRAKIIAHASTAAVNLAHEVGIWEARRIVAAGRRKAGQQDLLAAPDLEGLVILAAAPLAHHGAGPHSQPLC